MAKFSPISVMISNDTVAVSSVSARMTVDVLSFATLKVSQFSIPQKICFKLMARQLDKDSRDVKNIFIALKLGEFWGQCPNFDTLNPLIIRIRDLIFS